MKDKQPSDVAEWNAKGWPLTESCKCCGGKREDFQWNICLDCYSKDEEKESA